MLEELEIGFDDAYTDIAIEIIMEKVEKLLKDQKVLQDKIVTVEAVLGANSERGNMYNPNY